MKNDNAGPYHRPDNLATTPGAALNLACHDLLPCKDAQHRYLILSQPRTGSNYLCRRLCNVQDRFGLPSEYLNPRHMQIIAPRVISRPDVMTQAKMDIAQYLTAIERIRTTNDGMFGIKVHVDQILHHIGSDFEKIMKFLGQFDRMILMTRRDKLGQAISFAISQFTEVWFNDGKPPQVSAAQRRRMLPEIARRLVRSMEEERVQLEIARRFTRPMLRFDYEDIEADGSAAFGEAADFLTGGQAGPLVEDGDFPVPEKPPNDVAGQLREYFLRYIQDQKEP